MQATMARAAYPLPPQQKMKWKLPVKVVEELSSKVLRELSEAV